MNILRLRNFIALGLTAIMIGGAAPAALADPSGPNSRIIPMGCPYDYDYVYSNVSSHNVDMVPPASAPGGHTLSISLTAGLTVTGTVGGSVSGDVNLIVAGAKADVNASIALSIAASVIYTDTWTVPSTWTKGYLHAGAAKDKMNWAYGTEGGTCKWRVLRSVTADLPYQDPAFWHTQS